MYKFLATLFAASMLFLTTSAQTTAKEWYDKGLSFKDDDDADGAIDAFKKAVALKPDYADALHQLGWCYNDQEMYNDAVDVLLKEYNVGPTDKAANYFELGYAYENLAKYDLALTNLNNAIAIDINFAAAYEERGTVNYKLKKYDKALEDFNKFEATLKVGAPDADYYYKKGWVQNALNKYSDAIISLKKSLSLEKESPEAFSELGYSDYKLKLNDDALNNYTAAIALAPADYHPLLGIANVYYDNLKNIDSAIVYYEKGTQLQQKDEVAYYRLGWCYNDRDKFALAIPPLQKAISLYPNYPEAQKELGYAYYKLNRYDDALAQFEPLMATNTNDELSRYYAGFCYYLKKDQDKLKKMISELQALNSTRYVETLSKYVK